MAFVSASIQPSGDLKSPVSQYRKVLLKVFPIAYPNVLCLSTATKRYSCGMQIKLMSTPGMPPLPT